MSRIQNQNDQDIPIETDKEIVVAEQQRVQPPSIDTMETLTGPQQSPVSPTVSSVHCCSLVAGMHRFDLLT
jgi:hypothetical protein